MPKEKNEEKKADDIDPRMQRSNMDDMKAFINKCKNEIPGIAIKMVKVKNKEIPQEPTLIYGERRIAWCAPRAGLLFTTYIFAPGKPKEIHKIANDEQMENEFQLVKSICQKLDEKKAPKDEIASVEERLEKSKNGKIHIDKVTPQIIKWAEEQGHTLDDKGVLIRKSGG